MAWRLLWVTAMQPIDPQALSTVTGGFGAILGALLQAAPGILQGVSGIISASKSGGGGGQTASAAAGPPQPGGPAPATQASAQSVASAAPGGSASPCACCSNPLGSMATMSMVRMG